MWAVMKLAVYRIPVARFLKEAISLRIIEDKERGSLATTGGRAVLRVSKERRGVDEKCKSEGKKQVT